MPDGNINGYTSGISKCCKRQISTYKGYYWCYATDYPNWTPRKREWGSYNKLSVKQLDMKTHEVINIFSSITQAQEVTGIKNISAILSNKEGRTQGGGYLWQKN